MGKAVLLLDVKKLHFHGGWDKEEEEEEEKEVGVTNKLHFFFFLSELFERKQGKLCGG